MLEKNREGFAFMQRAVLFLVSLFHALNLPAQSRVDLLFDVRLRRFLPLIFTPG